MLEFPSHPSEALGVTPSVAPQESRGGASRRRSGEANGPKRGACTKPTLSGNEARDMGWSFSSRVVHDVEAASEPARLAGAIAKRGEAKPTIVMHDVRHRPRPERELEPE